MLRQAQTEILIATRNPGFSDITRDIADWLKSVGANDGLLNIFVRHTSASLTVQENADPDVQTDLLIARDGLAPRDATYLHSSEGADDMPAHIKSMLTSPSVQIPVSSGSMALGTWQAIYLIEHRDGLRERRVVLHFIGELA